MRHEDSFWLVEVSMCVLLLSFECHIVTFYFHTFAGSSTVRVIMVLTSWAWFRREIRVINDFMLDFSHRCVTVTSSQSV